MWVAEPEVPPVEFLIALLVAVAGLDRLAGALRVPYPVILVLLVFRRSSTTPRS